MAGKLKRFSVATHDYTTKDILSIDESDDGEVMWASDVDAFLRRLIAMHDRASADVANEYDAGAAAAFAHVARFARALLGEEA